MSRPLLLSLLFLLPLLSPAQAPPFVSLTHASLRMQPGDTAVDVALLVHQAFQYTHFLIVASRGNNRLYHYLQSPPQQFGVVDQYNTHSPPLTILATNLYNRLPTHSGQDDLVLLTQNGLLTSYLYSGSLIDSAKSVALRQGLPCAPTDRLVKGKYLGLPAPQDVALWSNGPQPGINYAAGYTLGDFVPRPRVPARAGDNARVMVTANLSGRASGYEDAIMGQATPAGGLTVWTNAGNYLPPAWLTSPTTTANYASAAGPVVALAATDVNGDAYPDVVAATAGTLSLHLNSGTGPLLAPFLSVPFPGPGTIRDVALADLNGDALPELLVLTSADILLVYQHAGPGSGTSYASVPVGYFTGRDPARLRVDDADGDGDLDVLVPCRGDHTVSFFWNDRIPLGAARPGVAAVALSTHPNPAQATVRLSWDAATGGSAATATLLDVAGRAVRQWPAQAAGTELPVAELPRGLYLLRVTGERIAATRRLVLQ